MKRKTNAIFDKDSSVYIDDPIAREEALVLFVENDLVGLCEKQNDNIE